MHASDWIALAGVIVAIAAVLVALLQANIKRWLWTPKIEIKESQGPAWIKLGPADYALWAYVRLRIGVKPGRTSAHQVQAYLISCEPAPQLGGEKEMPDPEFLIPLRWSFDHRVTTEIPAGGARYLDVLEVISRPTDKAGAFLTTVPQPPEGYRLVGRNSASKICVQVMGDNIPPKRHTFYILNTGTWNGTAGGLAGHLDTYAGSV
jgi:hypothetical protein